MKDEEIVRLYWERDEQALAETAKKYGGYCRQIAVNILGNGEDAEECVNDAYLNAWNGIPPHRPRVLSTFLGKLVRNLSLNRYRALHAEKRGGKEIVLVLDELGEIVSGGESAEENVMRAELLRAVNDFLHTLSAKKRYLFVRRYWYSDSVASLATKSGETETAVSVCLSRIRKDLRAYLAERGFEL